MRRRDLLRTGFAATAAAAFAPSVTARASRLASPAQTFAHSVCRWCFGSLPLDDLCVLAKSLGVVSVELVQPEDFATLKRHGLTCAMVSHPPEAVDGLRKGWNRPEHQAYLVPAYERRLAEVAQAGFPNLICFAGNRDGMSDEEGLDHCTRGLQRLMPTAERLGVTVCLELFNSKVDHPDYMGDSSAWGVELVRRVGSERFKLLYDIYHMQIMEGDVIRTITDHHAAFGHYHTAGVPGRHEIGDAQELFYPAIVRAIAATGFRGFVGQEFIPTGDPRTVLGDAVRRCTVTA